MKLLILESSTTSAKAMLYDTENAMGRIATKPYGFVQDSKKPAALSILRIRILSSCIKKKTERFYRM